MQIKSYVKRAIAVLFFIGCAFSSLGQSAPEKINYQAVARDGNGNVMQQSTIDVRLTVNDGDGNTYIEEHSSVSTNDYGLFTLAIGNGTPVSGTFGNLQWQGSQASLQVEVDDGSGFSPMGTSDLNSVPYSLHADMNLEELSNVAPINAGNGQVLKWDATNNEWTAAEDSFVDISAGTGISVSGNVITNTAPDQTITLTDSGATSISGSYPNFTIYSTDNVVDADADSTNELQSLSITDTNLTISSGNTVTLPGDDWGSQVVQSNASLSGDGTSSNQLEVNWSNADHLDATGSVTNADQLDGQDSTYYLDWNNFTNIPSDIADGDDSVTYTAGAGIAISGNIIANTAPDQTVTISDSGAAEVSGTYPNFTIYAQDSIRDADADPANELQSLSVSDSNLTISSGNTVTLPGDDWGTQVAQTGSAIIGDGTSGNELNIAQQGASTGQVLKWNGSSWVPAPDTSGDNWGTQVAQTGSALAGNGTAGSELDIAQQGANSGQVLKWNGSDWVPANDSVGAGGAGDNWGSQVVVSKSSLTGDGTSGNRLAVNWNDANDLDGSGNVLDAQQLGGENSIYYLDWNNFVNIPSDLSDGDDTATYVGGAGITVAGNTITNSDTDRTVTIAGSGATSVSGNYPNFTVSSTDNVMDADADSTNELQNLSITDTNLTISSGNTVTLPGDDWGNQTAQTGNALMGDGTSGNELNIAQQGASDGQVLKWNGTTDQWETASDNTGGSGGVNTDGTIQGDGTSGNSLGIAQQSANPGQVLKWNGSDWVPANDSVGAGGTGDDWGSQVVQSNNSLKGDGDTASKLAVKWQDANDLDTMGNVMDADKLDGRDSTYYLDWNNFTNIPSDLADGDDTATYVGGAGIAVAGNTITNSDTDRTVTIAGSGATSVSGSYPNFTVSSTDNVMDADADSTNELQNLSITDTNLTISSGNTVTLPGDNWGNQTAQTGNALTGNGTLGNELNIAQQGASNGQILKWNGSDWVPANDSVGAGGTGDDWGSQVVQSDNSLTGDGDTASQLAVNWQDANDLDASGNVLDAQQLSGENSIYYLDWNNFVNIPSDLADGDDTATYVGGAGIDVAGNTITNTDTDRTVTIAGSGATSVSGSYPNFTVSSTDNVMDADADSTNELQNLSITDTNLTISSGNTVTLPGDDWGNQVVQTGSALTGDGTSSTPLQIAQQSASAGQALKWDGSSWVPADDSTAGDDDWVTDTNGVHNTTDNVGIGTSNPVELLTLAGSPRPTMRINSDYTDTSSIVLSNYGTFGTNYFIDAIEEDGLFFHTASDLSENTSQNTLVLTPGGNVGIGSASPDQQLDVDGAIKVGNTTTSDSGAIRWTGSDFEGYDGGGWLSLTNTGSGTSDGDWTIYSTKLVSTRDSVGIGKTNPQYALDVDESATEVAVRGEGQFDAWGYLGVQGAANFDGKAKADWASEEIGVAGISNGLSDGDNYGVRGHSNGWGGRFDHSDSNHYVNLGGDTAALQIVDGNAADGKVLTSDGSGNAFWQDPAVDSSIWSASGSDAYYNDGNVGIGTSNPEAKLEVEGGDIELDGSNNFVSIDNSSPTAVSGYRLYSNGSFEGALFYDPDTDVLNLSRGAFSNTLVVDNANNVGIGTSTPAQLLDVQGAIDVGNTATSDSGSIRWTGSDFEGYDGNNWLSLTSGSDGDWTISSTKLVSNRDTVGIGKANPEYALDVDQGNTDVAVRGEGFLDEKGYLGVQGTDSFDTYSTANWANEEIGVAGISMSNVASDNYGVRGHSNGWGGRFEHSDSNHYVNLGGSNAALQIVDGEESSGKVLTSDGSGNASWQEGGDSDWSTGTNTIYNTSDSVGIGTSSPAKPLHVAGQVTIDSAVSIGTNSLGNFYSNFDVNIQDADGNGTTSVKIGDNTADELVIGSAETIEDGGALTLEVNSTLVPDSDSSKDLGSSSQAWRDAYFYNSPTITSDRRAKGTIDEMPYGLEEIMALDPVSYKLNAQHPEEKENLGLVAQEVEPIIDEVVKTHTWKPEEEGGELVKQELDQYGIQYTELVPVLVKSVQEQQQLIEEQKNEIEQQKQENEKLREELNNIKSALEEEGIKVD